MKFRSFAGPVSYVFVDPDTGYKYTALNRSELVKKILGYRLQNRLTPIESLDAVIDNYLCSLPENRPNCQAYRLERGFLKSVKGGVALLTNYMFKSFVSQEKADQRAESCIKCPHNVDPYKGKLSFWQDKLAEASVGDRRSKYHDKLHNCMICSCPLRPKVFFGEKLELTEDEISEMPNFCWQKQEVLGG